MAAGSTYTPIATQTLGSAAASVTFSSIPSTYTDLILIANNSSASNQDALVLKVGNGSVDTGSNYSTTFVYGTGSGTGSSRTSSATNIFWGRSSSVMNANTLHLMNYSNTSTYKTVLSRGNAADAIAIAYVGLWRSTSAINIITIGTEVGGNISAGSTFTLYGIAAA
jgi:hypothetical protein